MDRFEAWNRSRTALKWRLMLLVYIDLGESISCLQCVTLLDDGCDDGTLPATDCRANYSYCITYVGTVDASTSPQFSSVQFSSVRIFL